MTSTTTDATASIPPPAPEPGGDVPVLDVDPFSPEVLLDPLPMQHELRETGPLAYLSRYGVYAMGRYADVHAALTNWQGFISSAGVGVSDFRREPPWRPPSLLLEADPPHHDAPRAVLTSILSARALRRLRDRWLEDAREVVSAALARGGDLDGVADLAEVFPLRVFPDAVGLGPDGREHLIPYGSFAFNAFGPRNDLLTSAERDIGPTIAWIGEQCHRENLAQDGFGAQIWAASDRGDITPEQAPLVVRSLLTAGVDTTVNGLAACLHAFATHPDQYARLRTEPALARVAFDEAVRWESPVQTFFRTAEVDIDVSGFRVPADRKILMFLGSANRDPRRWEAPDAFDLGRDPSGHVGFGMGLHQCAGQHVARLEAEALLTALAERVDRLELIDEPTRKPNNTLRAWKHLPIRLIPAG